MFSENSIIFFSNISKLRRKYCADDLGMILWTESETNVENIKTILVDPDGKMKPSEPITLYKEKILGSFTTFHDTQLFWVDPIEIYLYHVDHSVGGKVLRYKFLPEAARCRIKLENTLLKSRMITTRAINLNQVSNASNIHLCAKGNAHTCAF